MFKAHLGTRGLGLPTRTAGVIAVARSAIVLPVLAGAACTLVTAAALQRQSERQREDTVRAVASAIAEPARVLVEADELSRLRMLVNDASTHSGITRLAVVLADGRSLADSDARRITATLNDLGAAATPEIDAPAGITQFGEVYSTTKVDTDRGPVFVVAATDVALPIAELPGAASLAVIGLGAVGVGALLLSRIGPSLRALEAIRDAMRSIADGDTASAALVIDARWGAEATAWNAFLAERQEMERKLLDRRVQDMAASTSMSDALLERACDAMSQGLIVLDPGRRVRYLNGAAAMLLGMRRDDALGKTAGELAIDAKVEQLVGSVLGDEGRRRAAIEVERGEEEARTVLRYTCVRAGTGTATGAAILVEDLTQQRIADRARETFVAQATHELRTPLTTIRMHLELLQEEGVLDAAARGQSLNVLNHETHRLERMVSDMLSVAEIEAGTFRLHADDVRLATLFSELEADFRVPAGEKGLTLTFTLPPKLPVIRGDKEKIAGILHNLIGNALKYTPASGTVTVEAAETDGFLNVAVHDSGIGIAPEEIEKVFEKFYRSTDKRVAKITGTGLGLPLAREMARLHGGDITVQSKLDEGSTFTLRLPLATPMAKAA